MTKKSENAANVPANQNPETTENLQVVKSNMELMKEKFDRLNILFKRKKRFEDSKISLLGFLEKLKTTNTDLENPEYKLKLVLGQYRDDDVITISNLEVIRETANHLITKIDDRLDSLTNDILNIQ